MLKAKEEYFFKKEKWSRDFCHKLITKSLDNLDDGELYIQEAQSEVIVFDDQQVQNASYNIKKGFGLRGVIGDLSAFAHSTEFSEAALLRSSEVIKSIKNTLTPIKINLDKQVNHNDLYQKIDPIAELTFLTKIELAQEIDAYIRSKNSYVRQLTVRIAGGKSTIQIIKAHGDEFFDTRPITQLSITVTLAKDGKLESGSSSAGARKGYADLFVNSRWQAMADNAIKTAMTKLNANAAPAGEFTVVLGNGDPGVLLHEAVGHGLEADFNRKKTSAFSDMIGQRIASKDVTIIDDGTMKERRGSSNFDDEGTPTKRNILVEDGILVGYMQDRMNAKLMGMETTGNGRRESYSCLPMPRMTNTFMLSGSAKLDDMIASVKQGIYCPKFAGGQVDITSGNFVFEADLAYLIEDGKITMPVKGASLIGNGPNVMKKIQAVGDDLELDQGSGLCGKDGQTVPVSIGQPSLLLDRITVGGSKI